MYSGSLSPFVAIIFDVDIVGDILKDEHSEILNVAMEAHRII